MFTRLLPGRARVARVVKKFTSITAELKASIDALATERSNNLAQQKALREEQFSIETSISQATALIDNLNRLLKP